MHYFASKTQRIQVGNRQFISTLLIIPIIIDIHGHRFKIHALVSEIHENVDSVIGIKKILEGIINSRKSCFSFLNRSLPFFPKEQIILKPKEQKLIKIEAPFMGEISGLAKVLDNNIQSAMILKLKFMCNSVILDVTNTDLETVIFNPKEVIGILDLRLMGYYKIKQGILQQNLSNYYRFESADTLCEQFINTMKKREKEETQESYPWLDPSDERKYMSDMEKLEKYIDLDKLCLTDIEKKQVMGMLCKL